MEGDFCEVNATPVTTEAGTHTRVGSVTEMR